jgi:hypothetical protein
MNVAVVDFSLENEDGPIFPLLRQVCESCKGAAENQFDFTELHEKIMQLEGFIFSLEQDEAGATALWQGLSPELIAGLNDASLSTSLPKVSSGARLTSPNILCSRDLVSW